MRTDLASTDEPFKTFAYLRPMTRLKQSSDGSMGLTPGKWIVSLHNYITFVCFLSEKPVLVSLYVVIDSFHDVKEEEMASIPFPPTSLLDLPPFGFTSLSSC